ncbi:MAG: aldo/keto reductase [Oscillospiraceae bacterium]|jgi:predicted aldo/keto reductase-like oxidoreductase|nr:aldo/keto reductase [Oscillospiraceae bacterium]
MRYRKDPKSGNDLSVLGFGCMRFPRGQQDVDALVAAAVRGGINYFDTAYMYPGNEAALGSALASQGLRDKVYIATKLPLVVVRGPQDFDRFFNKELERLQTDHIDYYLMHMVTDMGQWRTLCDWGIEKWIADKRADGAIRRIGFSFHGVRDEFLQVLNAYDWDFCQIQYNYSDENYQAGVTGLRRAAEKGLAVIIMEPLLGGKLATALPPEAVRVLRDADANLTPAAWGLRWLWNQPEATVVLSGMSTMAQLDENLATADQAVPGMLSAGELVAYDQVRDIFRASNKVPCTGCGYCLPCPRHVNIPACFSAYNASFAIGRGVGRQQYMTSTTPTSQQQSGARLCIKCRRCEGHCPQKIRISEELEKVGRYMEPWWYRAGIGVARVFLGRRRRAGDRA